jgi:hypothetical protein
VKVRFEFTLFLPFLLPRDSESWGSEPVWCTCGDLVAGILVRPRETVRDRPKSIDDVSVERRDGEELIGYQIISRPHTDFYESVAAIVVGMIENASDVQRADVQARYRNAAILMVRRFLGWCRSLASDTEIFFYSPEVTPEYSRFVGFPHYENWYDAETDRRIGDGTVNFAAGEDIVGRTGGVGIPWRTIRQSLESNGEPLVDSQLILDSQTALARQDDRKSIVFSAVAIEVACKRFLFVLRRWKRIRGQLKWPKGQGFADRYLDWLPRLANLPSLGDTNPALFGRMKSLFKVRNNIVHEGTCHELVDSGGTPVRLSRASAVELVTAAREAVAWINVQTLSAAGNVP